MANFNVNTNYCINISVLLIFVSQMLFVAFKENIYL